MVNTDGELIEFDMNECYIVDEDVFAAILNGHLIDLSVSLRA